MDELLVLLEDIVRAEYAQWMRYIFLSSLGYGLDTDQLVAHFEEHASDELDHAYLINRWLVDLGGMPPTDIPVIEPSFGSIEDAAMWLMEAEFEGIEKYNVARTVAEALDLHGLVQDIDHNISSENSHVSDLQNLVEPHLLPGDATTVVVVASKFRRFAAHGGEFFRDLVVDRIIGFYARTGRKLAKTQPTSLNDYLASMFDEAAHKAYQQFGDDTQKILDELPTVAYDLIKEDVETTVRDLWKNKHKPDARSGLEFYKEVYQWLNSPEVKDNWDTVFEKLNPKWKLNYADDWKEDLNVWEDEPYEPYSPTMEQIFQELEPQPEEETTEEAVTINDPEFQKEYQEYATEMEEQKKKRMETNERLRLEQEERERKIKEQEQQDTIREQQEMLGQEPASKRVTETSVDLENPSLDDDTRRPVTKSIGDKIKVRDADDRSGKKMVEAGVGDMIFNQSARQMFRALIAEGKYGIKNKDINQLSTGKIKEIQPDGKVVVDVDTAGTNATDEVAEQIWDSGQHKLWSYREEGKRTAFEEN